METKRDVDTAIADVIVEIKVMVVIYQYKLVLIGGFRVQLIITDHKDKACVEDVGHAFLLGHHNISSNTILTDNICDHCDHDCEYRCTGDSNKVWWTYRVALHIGHLPKSISPDLPRIVFKLCDNFRPKDLG